MLDNRPELSVLHRGPRGDGSQIGPVMAYWQALRRDRVAPARSEIDPVAIQPYLSQSGIIERAPNGMVKIRVAGQQMEELMGMDMRGMPLRTLFAVAHRARFEDILNQMFDGPRLLTMTLSAAFDAQPLVTAQMALMPLSDPSGRISRALLVLTPQARPAETPCRFHIRHAHLAQISTHAPADVPQAVRPQLRVIEGGVS